MAQKEQFCSFPFNENPKGEIRLLSVRIKTLLPQPQELLGPNHMRPAQNLIQTRHDLVATTLPAPGTHDAGIWRPMEKGTVFVLLLLLLLVS